MKRTMWMLSIALLVLLQTGCATIATGTEQAVSFQSIPAGATVEVRGRTLGKTPLFVKLQKDDKQTLFLSKPGYKTVVTRMHTELEPMVWGNFLLGPLGMIGLIVDYSNNAGDKYAPADYLVTLEPLPTPTSQ